MEKTGMTISELRKTIEKPETNQASNNRLVLRADIKQMRIDAGLKLTDVSSASLIQVGNLFRIESGNNLHLDTALRLARFYELKVEDIWGLPE